MKYLAAYLFLFISFATLGQIPSVWEEVKEESPEYELEQIELFTNAILTGEDSLKYEYFYWRGMNKYRIDDFNGAISDFDESIKLFPENCSSIGMKGSVYFTLKNRDKACFLWEKANEICPKEFEQSLRVHCDSIWNYAEVIKGCFLDTTLFDFDIYSGDTSITPKSELYYRGNDYSIYYDIQQTNLCQKRYTQNDTVIIYEYYLNGRVKELTNYFDDIWIYSQKWYSNGNMKINARNPNSDSLKLMVQYWENGNVSFKHYWKNLHGSNGGYWSYHENGMPWEIGTYSNNQKVDVWQYYNEEGRKTMEETYENGKLISTNKL